MQGEYTFPRLPASLTFGLVNATNADNVSGYFFEPDGNETPDDFTIAKEVGMPIFVYIGFKVMFK
jgi:hypothetical protein